jgi:hypothetical protein
MIRIINEEAEKETHRFLKRLSTFCSNRCLKRGCQDCCSCALKEAKHVYNIFKSGVHGDGSHVRRIPKKRETSCFKEVRKKLKCFFSGKGEQWVSLRDTRSFLFSVGGITDNTARNIINSLVEDKYVDKRTDGKGCHLDATLFRKNNNYAEKETTSEPSVP